MIRKIIKINEEKCNGCGLCAEACHEGAIAMVDGKAKLIRDDYCDGLGDCLPTCPTGAISFEMREAAEYDQAAVDAHLAQRNQNNPQADHAPQAPSGCPGSRAQAIRRQATSTPADAVPVGLINTGTMPSRLNQWPVQIQLVPANAPYFDQAKLLIAADCTAFSRADFHERFMKGKITLIGCPKLDSVDYADKLTQILLHNDIKSLTVVRMEVPCCGGIVHAVQRALQSCGKLIPWQIVTLSTDGQIIED